MKSLSAILISFICASLFQACTQTHLKMSEKNSSSNFPCPKNLGKDPNLKLIDNLSLKCGTKDEVNGLDFTVGYPTTGAYQLESGQSCSGTCFSLDFYDVDVEERNYGVGSVIHFGDQTWLVLSIYPRSETNLMATIHLGRRAPNSIH